MRARPLQEQPPRAWMLVFDVGDDVIDCLLRFAEDERLGGGSFTAVGACQQVTLGYWDIDRKEYLRIEVPEQVEVCSLIGNLARDAEGGPRLHAHAVVALRDGTTRGGHLLAARVRPTLELVLREAARPLLRRLDPASGLALLQ